MKLSKFGSSTAIMLLHVHSNMVCLYAQGMLPQQVILSVVSTDTVAKGDEKSPQYKPAIVGSGRKIMVPPFIAQGKFFDSYSIVIMLFGINNQRGDNNGSSSYRGADSC